MNLYKLTILSIAAFSVFALSSCGCCTGEERAPKLRALPAFNDLPGANSGAGSDSVPAPELSSDPAPVEWDSAK